MDIKTVTITISEIQYSPLQLWLQDGRLHYRQSYLFIDTTGVARPNFQKQPEVNNSMAWADVPQNIKDALTEVDGFVKNEINKQEGLG